jgi:glycosyltransferase involved in cell wall biosynthesis
MIPFFSIITVTYNSDKTIKDTIFSLLDQEFLNFEYIIVDGGSQDSTISIINNYLNIFKLKGIDVTIVSEPDLGIYDAMNKGIRLARGEWIGIINSDDYYNRDAFFEVFSVIKLNLGSAVVFGNMNVMDLNGKFLYSVNSFNLNELPYTMSIFHPTVFVKKEVYIIHGLYSLNFKLCSDWELLKRLYSQNLDFVYCDYLISNFRTGGSGSGFRLIHFLERFRIRHKPFIFSHLIYTIKDFILFIFFNTYLKIFLPKRF